MAKIIKRAERAADSSAAVEPILVEYSYDNKEISTARILPFRFGQACEVALQLSLFGVDFGMLNVADPAILARIIGQYRDGASNIIAIALLRDDPDWEKRDETGQPKFATLAIRVRELDLDDAFNLALATMQQNYDFFLQLRDGAKTNFPVLIGKLQEATAPAESQPASEAGQSAESSFTGTDSASEILTG